MSNVSIITYSEEAAAVVEAMVLFGEYEDSAALDDLLTDENRNRHDFVVVVINGLFSADLCNILIK